MLRSLRSFFILTAALCLTPAFVAAAQAQDAPSLETGKFRLHKFQQPIGEESYEITRDDKGIVVKSDFKFTDRGSEVPLSTHLRTDKNYRPTHFDIKGKTSRQSTIDDEIDINGTTASIREGKETRQASVPAHFFTIAGYAPATMQMMIAAADLGVGSGHSAVGDQDVARAVLGLPEDRVAAYVLDLGYPADRPLKPIRRPNRREFEDVVHRGTW